MSPDNPGRSRTAGPGRVSARHRWSARRCRHKAGVDTPTERWPAGGSPAPTRAPSARGDQHKGHLLFRPLVPGRCGLCRRRGPPASVTGFPVGHKAGTDAPAPRPSSSAPGAPRGRRPRRPQRARPAGAPEARRVLDALLELHRHGCGGAHWHEDRGAPSGILSQPGPLVRPPAPRSAPARPGMRPR